MNKLHIAVVFGGVSTEHDISLISATNIIEGLNREKYVVYYIGITKDGRFLSYNGDVSKIKNGEWENGDVAECFFSTTHGRKGFFTLQDDGCKFTHIDCVIPVLHGKNGEDGTIQGLLQLAEIPFVGCDTISSANCMDKEMTHIILGNANVPMARWDCVRLNDDVYAQNSDTVARLEKNIAYPMFIKPANAGSSFGISKAHNRDELLAGIKLAFEHDKKVIVEETLIGREIECAVLGNEDAAASPAGEIEPSHEFYDFDSKYVDTSSKLHIPARISEKAMAELREIAVHAYHAIGCAGLSRVDFFVTEDERVILNEINTLPGFTNISMYPKLWEKAGVPLTILLDKLIAYGINRK